MRTFETGCEADFFCQPVKSLGEESAKVSKAHAEVVSYFEIKSGAQQLRNHADAEPSKPVR